MTTPLWTLVELLAVTGGTLGEADPSPSARPSDGEATPKALDPGSALRGDRDDSASEITGFSIDTRSLRPGEAFVALKDVRDGHEFVGAAFKAGAAAALVRVDYARQPGDGVLLRVDDPLAALTRIARAARARLSLHARVVAVTGSAGKTTTKEMLRVCLEAVAPEQVHASIKSYNNHWGVPLMLANMPADTRFGVFEIGMNHAGEITPLAKLVRPHVAVVVNVLPVHVGNFADGEVGVANAKAEIFAGLSVGGVAVIPADSPHRATLEEHAAAAGARVATFGDGFKASVRLVDAKPAPAGDGDTTAVTAQLSPPVARETTVIGFTLGVSGRHLVANALAVAGALVSLGAPLERSLGALAGMSAPEGRGTRTVLDGEGGPVLLVDESYNANPASMAAALATAGEIRDQRFARRVAVLGDMLELGEEAVAYHVGLRDAVVANADLILACGPNMKHLHDALPEALRGGWGETAEALEGLVLAAIRPGDIVMVKGSNGARTWAIVAAIKMRFATATAGR